MSTEGAAARQQSVDGAANSNRTVGRPFQPGQSGNPSGRPSLPAEVKVRLAKLGPKAVARLQTLMASKNEAIALRAAEAILDRAYGKAVQAIDIDSDATRRALESLAREFGKPLEDVEKDIEHEALRLVK